jgi:peroxiredoxin Q/BCP
MKPRALVFLLPFVSLLACSNEAVPPPAAPSSAPTSAPTVQAAAAPAAASELAIGQPAPDFTGMDQNGKSVHLGDFKGHYVVVYFYPKDETPGCTKEACSFRDSWANLQKRGVVILGVSTDTTESHKAFAAHFNLPFTLVSDPQGEIAAKYGVPLKEGYVHRESFVVAPDGNVKKIYRTVDVTKHADEILADVSS